MAGNKIFGKQIKKLREQKGFSQEKLAELVGLEYQTISRIETGYYFTNYDNLVKIANALNVKLKDLFDYDDEKILRRELIKNIKNDIESLDDKKLITLNKIISLIK